MAHVLIDADRPSEPEAPAGTAPFPTPREIKKALDEYIIGQEQAKKKIAVAVYNHYKRISLPAGPAATSRSPRATSSSSDRPGRARP